MDKKGFTIIELIIVITIIGILASVIFFLTRAPREASRNNKRLSDMQQLHEALGLYKIDEGTYPSTITVGEPLVGPTSKVIYISKVPSNPIPRTDGSCADSEYIYTQDNSGTSYHLSFCLGKAVSGLSAGSNEVNPEGIKSVTAVSNTWYDNSWAKRKKITLSGQSGAGTDYSVLLEIGESSGSSGADFNLEGNAQNFPDDLRFTDDDKETLLDYWVESTTGTAPNQTASVWVQVNDNLDSDTDIYVYYDNSSASSASNLKNTFIFAEDFEDLNTGTLNGQNGWVEGGTTFYEVQTSIKHGGSKAMHLPMQNTNIYYYVTHALSTLDNWQITYYVYNSAGDAPYSTARLRNNSESEGTFWMFGLRVWPIRLYYNGNYIELGGVGSQGTWNKLTMEGKSSKSIRAKLNSEPYTSWYDSQGGVTSAIDEIYFNAKGNAAASVWTGEYYWDDIIIRKKTETEPDYSSVSTEESAS